MLKIDLHIHTIYSGHAYGTLYDILEEAARKKMKMIAIADHGPSVPGTVGEIHFMMGKRAPKTYKGVKLLWGCEANVIDKKGNLDLKEKTIKKLDILLVGIHDETNLKDYGKKKNTQAIINCFKKHKPHIFVHPSTMYYSYDIEEVCQAACDHNVLLELNLSSLKRLDDGHHREDLGLFKKMIAIAKKNKKKMIVNSDAHFLHEIGDDSIIKKYKKKLGITDNLIINNYPKELDKILKRKVA